MKNVKEPTNRCWYCILSALDLRAKPRKIQKCYFLSMGLEEHTKWCGATHLDIRAPKVRMQNVKEPTNRCWYCILFALDLRAKPRKIQKYYFLSMRLEEHTKWCGATHLNIRAPKVHFLAKMTKMPIVKLGLTEGQTRSKSSQNNNFHDFFYQTRASQKTYIILWWDF